MLGTWEKITVGLTVADKLMDAFESNPERKLERAEKRYQRWLANKNLWGKPRPKISRWQYQRMHTMLLRKPAYIWHDEPTPEPFTPSHAVLTNYSTWLASKQITDAQYVNLLDRLVTGDIVPSPPLKLAL